MTWATDWKMELNKRNNKEKIGAVVGTILNLEPLKIGILNNKVILDNKNSYTSIYFSKLLKSFVEVDGKLVREVSINDNVLIIASEDNQTFFIVDKLV